MAIAAPPAVLHGTWLPTEGRLFVWGELAERMPRRSRHRRRPGHPPHPAQVHTDALQARVADLLASTRTPPFAERTIWLPSVLGQPLPLRELRQAGAEIPAGQPTLAPWRVRGLLLTAAQALDLLLPPVSDHGFGADLRVWRVAALLAVELVAGQQILPALIRDGGGLRACWEPRPVPALARKIATLRSAMPPLCRALAENLDVAPAPRMLLDSFLAASVDALVRQVAINDPSAAAQLAAWRSLPPSPGSAWMVALLDRDASLHLRGREADELFRAWKAWAGQEQAAGDETFRITFRLEAPSDPYSPWALRYMLQAIDDPSLLIPATQIWRERGQHFIYLDRRFTHPQERMLRGLAFAARLVPAIERSLRDKAPDHASLSIEEAFAFLKDGAPLLEQSGFGVLVPSWWGDAGRLKARAKAAPRKMKRSNGRGPSRLSFQSMIDFRWELSVGEQPIDQAEFERLVALKQPLVQVRGEWVVLDPDQTRKALDLFAKGGGELTMAELLRMGLAGVADDLPPGLAFGGVDAEGDLGDLLRSLANTETIEQLPQPADFSGTLRPYQLRGLAWMAFMRRFGMGACLADDMGLGKTAEAIALLLHDRRIAPKAGPTLLVCPTSVMGNWQRELARFAPSLRVHLHQGAERHRGERLEEVAAAHDVVVTSYPLLARDRESLTALDWRMAILDEAQNIKNSDTRQAQAARAIRADARLALTGTPVENRLSELWSIMAFLNPGYLGGETEFRRNFARPIERAGDADVAAQLRHLTAPFILRRLKTDRTIINDLPEKLEMKVFVPLTQEQATLYEATVREALSEIADAESEEEQTRRRGLVLAMLTKLKQICNHPAHFLKDGSQLAERSGKLARLDEMLEEVVAAEDRALIFTQFAEMGTLLQAHLSQRLGQEILFLHGGTPTRSRDGMVRRFQAPEGPPIFILSLKAGGVGLNLTRASHVFHFDRWWNPAVEDQATDRSFRIGQTRNVQVHKFVSSGTLEEKIDEMIEGKRALAAQVLGAGEAWLTELSTDQLRELVALRREAE
ncbi:SNF2-related helicase [Oscillochloris trichoides DG-6]|uniref:SNF2-related helicase n=1 Tax=Oscillochloris trichoides DG-6 TaxID=765420 RepID=E1IC91_9CHLR|nr:DEAD/DEAH box helicase [Oscillochloris trichoides]EFO81208.1 SNF2-related helicase [Oscillochloris trichoides DG-6]